MIVFSLGLWYLESRSKKARKAGEGYYGFNNELAAAAELEKESVPSTEPKYDPSVARQILAFVPLVLVGVANKFFYCFYSKVVPRRF